MGGAAFASGPNALYTPRMPPAVYTAVRDRCHAVLYALFTVVATPVEGPGKADFGDVDILMALPKGASTGYESNEMLSLLLNDAASRLGAVRTAVVANEGKASIAVPWPADLLSLAPYSSDHSPESGPHIQVDLAIAPSLPRLHWALFKHAHGDFWNILGSAVLRPLGLTVDERALWLRVPEIERAHRNRAKVFLTDEPATVLHFLGLRILDGTFDISTSVSLWEQPFPTAQALFKYATTSRFFLLPDYSGNDDDSPADGATTGITSEPLALKANDRRRLLYRPLFRQWATEFVPAYRASGRYVAKTPLITRDDVRDAAFAYFPGSQARYEAARTGVAARAATCWPSATRPRRPVPASLPSQYRGEVCAAVRRHLGLVMDGQTGVSGEGNTAAAEEAAAVWTVEGVTAHVEAHWLAISAEAVPTVGA